jgi:hypothetical protein
MAGQSVDYVAIRAEKRDPLQYPPGACTPSKRGHGPPRGEAATIGGEFPCICR